MEIHKLNPSTSTVKDFIQKHNQPNIITETKHIFNNFMEFNLLDCNTKHELLTWYDTITKQNYFIKKENIITQNDRSAMGALSSGILSEIFL
jgi:hypothetical protein